ncbi:MAG: TIGR00282 family metallophosphoesterase [Deltaproteobacteria bacterium]|nr:TIGR00282 family metallophosphoesterase [Deltaproteobacteria bacterium]
MRILFIGDIIGRVGRRAIGNFLPKIIDKEQIGFVIANGENLAGGIGITPDTAKELFKMGVDVITTGNHVWKKKEIIPYLKEEERILRPINYPELAPGRGFGIYNKEDKKVGVINAEGRIFMNSLDCPFRTTLDAVEEIKRSTSIIIVDFHAEATSEKEALGWFLDGKISALIGTHTHVQTNDDRILPGGTGYITDAGMTGPVDSVIGINKDIAIKRFLSQMPYKFEVAKGEVELNGVIIDVEDISGKCINISKIKVKTSQI